MAEQRRDRREIAYTRMGSGALVLGVLAHLIALLAAMVAGPAASLVFRIAYVAAFLAFSLAAYIELADRRLAPLRDWRFFLALIATPLPLRGPFAVLTLLWRRQPHAVAARGGALRAFLRLKLPMPALLGFLFALLVLAAVAAMQDRRYIAQVRPHATMPAPGSTRVLFRS